MPEQLSTVDNLVSENVTVNSKLQVPRLGTAERDALTALSGWIIYNTTDDEFQVYDGNWTTMLSDGTFVNSSVIQSGNFSQHIERQKIQATDIQADDSFGSLVDISGDGNYLVVGSKDNANSGAIYVFKRYNNIWVQQQKIVSSDIEIDDFFGFSVAINSDGTYIVAGVNRETVGGSSVAGSAYIFTRLGNTWSEQQKIQASDVEANIFFRESVAINSDGTYIVVGVGGEDGLDSDPGSAYIFTRSDNIWTEQQKIQASDKQLGDLFGTSVAINSDGTYIVVGDITNRDNGFLGSTDRAAYIFKRSNNIWTEQQKIVSSDIEASNYSFGESVAINSDATYIVVGASGEDNEISLTGAAYIFTRSNNIWTEQQKIQSSVERDFFGLSVAINSDATYIVVGASGETIDGSSAGVAYIFNRSGTTWTQQQKIQSSDIQSNDVFGTSITINSDATYIVVGASGEDTNGSNAGAAYIFKGVEENVAPSFTETERDAIAVPNLVAGMIILNTTTSKINFYTGSAWEAITSA